MNNYTKISKIERCKKCSGFRELNVYSNGMREKIVYKKIGIKCKHKWREVSPEEIGKIK